jgi:transcriptional regulator with XRE-family HTH domain
MSPTSSSEYRRFLARLRAARRSYGLTQAQVAQQLHRPQSFVSKCESGERRVDAVELARFARLYGKPLGYFVGVPDA